MTFRTAAAVSLGAILSVLAWTGGSPASGGASPATPFSNAKPVNVVILADESGSMLHYPDEITGEQQAAIEIVQAAWSPYSQIAMYGFGSAPPTRGASPSQAVDKLCGLTELNTMDNLNTLTRCANLIAPRRQPGEDNTDFAAALTEAENVLSAPDPLHRVPLVFILTDGMLDVGANSPYAPWPSSDQAGNVAAQQKLTGIILPEMKSLGIQIWPVGFGQADQGELSKLARGGAQVNPNCPAGSGGAPQRTVVPPRLTGAAEAEQIQQQLLRAFAAASCGTINPGPWHTLPPGGHITVPVTIDPLTTLGSIIVNKGDPRVAVSYTDPDGGAVSDNTTNAQAAGVLHGAAYVLTTGGTQSRQEALRLDGPVPGQWKVTFTNPSAVAQTVGVSVVWQGQVFPDITFSPRQIGDSGHPLQIQVKPAIRSAPVPASELSRLTVGLTVQWTQGGAPQRVAAKLDQATGEFVGTVKVPSGRKGTAVVTAVVQERGVQGTAVTKVGYQPGGGMSVDLNIPPGIRVSPGGTLSETAIVDNVGQPATSIEFSLAGLGDGVDAWIARPSGAVTIGSGQVPVPVTIRFAAGTPRGQALGTVQWTVVGSDIPNSAAYLDVTVEPPPTPWYEQWWPWTLLVGVLAGLGGLRYFRRHREQERLRREQDNQRRRDEQITMANLDVQHAGLALIRRDKPDKAPFVRWTGGYIQERWFDVRRAGGIPVLTEATTSGTGLIQLRRDPADGTFIVAAAPTTVPEPAASHAATAPELEPAPPSVKRVERDGEPFDPPEGTGLDDCLLMLTQSGVPTYTPPDPDMSGLLVDSYEYPGMGPAPIGLSEEFSRPEPISLNDIAPDDGSTNQ